MSWCFDHGTYSGDKCPGCVAKAAGRKLPRKPRRYQSGVKMIEVERQRQIFKEFWTPEHDDTHTNFELSSAACCYGQMGAGGPYSHPTHGNVPPNWPWRMDKSWWKPDVDPIRNLVKAGALMAAEIDRLQRQRRFPRKKSSGLQK